jgi:cephalosporin hydroxylase
MERFWDIVIHPLLAQVSPSRILEIGAAEGRHTKKLLEYCSATDAVLHMIDPLPRFNSDEWQQLNAGKFYPHRTTSLKVLGLIGTFDVVLIDGDHNWYTVFHELMALQANCLAQLRPMPVIVCHDTLWPYAYRDLYYDPGSIPPEFLQPFRRAGVLPGHTELVDSGGLNVHLCHAEKEGGPRNGVKTAINDFLSHTGQQFFVVELPVLYGLTLLIPTERTKMHVGLSGFLDAVVSADGWRKLALLADQFRVGGEINGQVLVRALSHSKCDTGTSQVLTERFSDTYSSGIPAEVLRHVQHGVLQSRYKGARLLKSPFDMYLYGVLLERLRPGTIIEIGTLEGGSAIWFADQMQIHGMMPCVVSVDKNSCPVIHDARVLFLECDGLNLSAALDVDLLSHLPRPWLVVEDSAHTFEVTQAVLDYFDSTLRPGDYIVVEDGIVRDMLGEIYRKYDDGPCRAVADFLARKGKRYEVDVELCDFYGPNYTFNPRGYLRRTAC